jgi:hypothetical protein
MSLVAKIKFEEEEGVQSSQKYEFFLKTIDKLNAPQLEKAFRQILKRKGISIPRDFQNGKANENYRLGILTGVFVGLQVALDPEAALLDEENLVRAVATVIAKDTTK